MKTKKIRFALFRESGLDLMLQNESADYARVSEWVNMEVNMLPASEIQHKFTPEQEKDNLIQELMGKLDCSTGKEPDSENGHYLHGYGEQVAIENNNDAMTRISL